MTLKLNGESRIFDTDSPSLALPDLLKELGLDKIPVLVEHNGVALRPREHDDRNVENGDELEIIRIVAGG